MKSLPTVLLLVSTLFKAAKCHDMSSIRPKNHGLIGYGIQMYFPNCCISCRDALSSSQLNCSEVMDMDRGHHMKRMDMGEVEFTTSLDCFATDDAFLQSLALCISQRCPTDPTVGNLQEWQIEKWWLNRAAGRLAIVPEPKYTFGQALARIESRPTASVVSGEPLNQTMLVSDNDYQPGWNANMMFERMEVTHERYALVVVLSGFVIPVALSLLRFLPVPSRWSTLFNAYVIDPPAMGSKHKVSILFGLTQMPTRGQALFISYLLSINVVLSAVGYTTISPNSWWPDNTSRQLLVYVANRIGVLSFANIPLLILYAGRNNILIWITNWSHETFVLLHRYVAGIATLQAVLHSLIYLQIYVADGTHNAEAKTPFWHWGAIATIGMSMLLPMSILPIRRMIYEAFLLWHVAISILVVVGCYYHIIYKFQTQWGYETWVYVAIAIWGFDRVMRLARVLRNGLRWAVVTVIDDDYLRVDVESVHGSGYAYLCFPTLSWRVWENHPFSVASTMTPTTQFLGPGKVQGTGDVEKNSSTVVTASCSSSDNGTSEGTCHPSKLAMTFLVRTRGGLTSILRASKRVPVLVDGSYGQRPGLLEHPTLICVAGGVGITAVLPVLRSHPGRKRLLWGVRNASIVDALAGDMAGIDKEVFIGQRMVILDELRKELSCAAAGENAAVMVSGPESMADDVRNAVCLLAKEKKNVSIRLVEESFSW